MTSAQWLEYGILNSTAAAAIALDACLMIMLRFRSLRTPRAVLLWAGAVGVTHVAFPMIGFAGGWWLIRQFHLDVWVYGVGVVLLVVLIRHVVTEAGDAEHGEAHSLDIRLGSLHGFWAPVLVVSLDALLSGPGKVVMVERYSERLAIASFVVVGVLVALFTAIAGWIAWQLRRRFSYASSGLEERLVGAGVIGIFLELSLFSFFLVWTLGKALQVSSVAPAWCASWTAALPIAIVVALALFVPRRNRFVATQRAVVMSATGR